MMPRDEMVDPDVRAKCDLLYKQWAASYKNVPGLGGIAALHKQLPTKARPQPSQSKVIRETEREAATDPYGDSEEISGSLRQSVSTPEPVHGQFSGGNKRRSIVPGSPSLGSSGGSSSRTGTLSAAPIFGGTFQETSSKKDKKGKQKPFNLEKEKTTMLQTIAHSSVASTNMLNALQRINRETTQVSEDRETAKQFETCKLLRRQILRYIQLVESDQWIGSLLSANDELVKALMAYELMDKSVDDDSDSEVEGSHSGPPPPSSRRGSKMVESMAAMNVQEHPPVKPPRPQSGLHQPPIPASRASAKPKTVESDSEAEDDEEDDDDDPFGDRNAIKA